MAIPLVPAAAVLGVYLLSGKRTGDAGSEGDSGLPPGIPKNPGGSDKSGNYNPKTPSVPHTDDYKEETSKRTKDIIFGLGGLLKDVPVVKEVVKAAMVSSYASYELTKLMTGSETAGIAAVVPGAINPVHGIIVGSGVKGGELFASAAGGSADQFNRSSDAYSQAAGGAIASSALYISASAAAMIVAPLAFIGYGIASLFEDAARLGYGQNGINGRLQSLKTEIQNRTVSALSMVSPPDSLPAMELAGKLLGEAYVKQYNETLFNAWLSRNKGVTVSWNYHGIWGRDRGYFSGDVTGDGPTKNYVQLVPTFTADFGDLPPEYASDISFQNAILQFRGQANAYLYARHMQKDARALGISDSGHAQAGINEGQYYGVIHKDWTSTAPYKAARKAAVTAAYGAQVAELPIANTLPVGDVQFAVMLNGGEAYLNPAIPEDIGYLEFPANQFWDWRTIAVKDSEG